MTRRKAQPQVTPANDAVALHSDDAPEGVALPANAPELPVINLMDALVTSLAPAAELAHAVTESRASVDAATAAAAALTPPPERARRATPRRVSAEVVKAETALLSLERRRQESLAHHERVWADKRVTLILGLPADVHTALRAMGVLAEGDPR